MPHAKIGPKLTINHDNAIVVVEYAARAELFANDAPEGLKAKLPDLILDEPLARLTTAVSVTCGADAMGRPMRIND